MHISSHVSVVDIFKVYFTWGVYSHAGLRFDDMFLIIDGECIFRSIA